ncbi:MAG: hypothetical protein V9G08_12270 [Dermatophilaceae bacterium]
MTWRDGTPPTPCDTSMSLIMGRESRSASAPTPPHGAKPAYRAAATPGRVALVRPCALAGRPMGCPE